MSLFLLVKNSQLFYVLLASLLLFEDADSYLPQLSLVSVKQVISLHKSLFQDF